MLESELTALVMLGRSWTRSHPKWLIVLLTAACLGLAVSACDRNSVHTATRGSAALVGGRTASDAIARRDADRDDDFGAAPHDDISHKDELSFGRAATPDDKRAITALVKRYYATALAGDGSLACSMVYSALAEVVSEDYGSSAGPAYMRGAKSCSAGLTDVFQHYHGQLGIEVPRLRVDRVRVHERHGLALLSFGSLPEREITLMREGSVWKLAAFLDHELP